MSKLMIENNEISPKNGEIEVEDICDIDFYSNETYDLIDYFRENRNSFVELNGSWDSTKLAVKIKR